MIAETEKEKQEMLLDYINREQYKKDFLRQVKGDIERGLSFVHDYKQINSTISQNINVIIEKKYSGNSIDEKIDKAEYEEKAIYYASKLLAEKLIVSKFLMNPSWLDKREECKPFRFHGMVFKYLRIYQHKFQAKSTTINFTGHSDKEILANPGAVSVIPHTLIDNAQKYSPKNSIVNISVQDLLDGISFQVGSFGPLIHDDEKTKIFNPFYRGIEARKQEEEGSGYGLYVSQMIATKHLGREITVKQEKKRSSNKGFWTEFSIIIPDKAVILF